MPKEVEQLFEFTNLEKTDILKTDLLTCVLFALKDIGALLLLLNDKRFLLLKSFMLSKPLNIERERIMKSACLIIESADDEEVPLKKKKRRVVEGSDVELDINSETSE